MGDSTTKPSVAPTTETKQETKQPQMFRVLLHNDDYTTMDFVVSILVSVFRKPKDEAVRIMLNVHHQGIGVCGVYPSHVAETKVATVHSRARDNGFPLRCSMEPE
jgi:ATP-dependent Clp protease adaptor protein ClpS